MNKLRELIKECIKEIYLYEYVISLKHPNKITDKKLKNFLELLSNFSKKLDSKQTISLIHFRKKDMSGEYIFPNSFIIAFEYGGDFLVYEKDGKYGIAKVRINMPTGDNPYNYTYETPQPFNIPNNDKELEDFIKKYGKMSGSPDIVSK